MKIRFSRTLAGIFLLARLILLVSMSLEGLRGFGDFAHFYRMAHMGVPFLDIWVEFPPVFPFFSWLVFQLSAGREHIYDYLMVISLSLAQAATLVVFYRLAVRVQRAEAAQTTSLVYAAILLALPYGWWYFDAIPVLLTLLGLEYLLEGRDIRSALTLGVGVLTKLFPALLLPLVLKTRPPGQAVRMLLATGAIIAVAYLPLWVASPDLTAASIRSQASKGSWETVWALLDGNLITGNFGPEIERYEAANAAKPSGNPPKIPAWVSLLPFAALGLWLYRQAHLGGPREVIAFAGLTWCIFSIWSPGYSPQWVLYLLPLVLLVLPEGQAVLMAFSLVFINLLEWPVLLSRGYNWGLYLTVPMRTLLWALLAWVFWSEIRAADKRRNSAEVDWKIAGQA